MHGVGDHEALLAHAASLTDTLDLGVEPEVGMAPLERSLAEGGHLIVDARAQARDLVL